MPNKVYTSAHAEAYTAYGVLRGNCMPCWHALDAQAGLACMDAGARHALVCKNMQVRHGRCKGISPPKPCLHGNAFFT
eukprot:365125-Chlamydomonas_euryale.AAC.14